MKITKLKIKNCNSGYALLELLFYIALFVIFSLLIINALITMTKSFRETTINRELAQAGTVLEIMNRNIRQSYDFTLINESDLKLDWKDGSEVAHTVELLLSDGNIELVQDDVSKGNINTSGLRVTDLSFTPITTTRSKAVTISLSVQAVNDQSANSKNFNDTVMLRGSY